MSDGISDEPLGSLLDFAPLGLGTSKANCGFHRT
jgi:hypothetical protein